MAPLSVSASVFLDAQAFSQALLAAQPAVAGAWAQGMSATLFRAGFEDEFVEQLHETARAIEDASRSENTEGARQAHAKLASIVKTETESRAKRWPGFVRIFAAQQASEAVEKNSDASFEWSALLFAKGAAGEILISRLGEVTGGVFQNLTPEEDLVMRLTHGIPFNSEGRAVTPFNEVDVSEMVGVSEAEVKHLKQLALEKLGGNFSRGNLSLPPADYEEIGKLETMTEVLREVYANYFMLRGIPYEEAKKFVEANNIYWDWVPHLPDFVVSLETGVSIYQLREKLFGKNLSRYLDLFVGNEDIKRNLTAAIRQRDEGLDELAKFIARLGIEDLNEKLAVYLAEGFPLDLWVFHIFLMNCKWYGLENVIQTYHGIHQSFKVGSEIDTVLLSDFIGFHLAIYYMEKYFGRGIEVRQNFLQLLARLQKLRISHYLVDVKLLPDDEALFSFAECLADVPLKAHSFRSIIKFYHLVNKLREKGFPPSIFSKLVGDEEQRAIYQSYKKKARIFMRPFDYCLGSNDPLKTWEKMKSTMMDFQKGTRSPEPFGDLKEREKLALYAMAGSAMSKYSPGSELPSYKIFVGFLKIALEVLEVPIFGELGQKDSRFVESLVPRYHFYRDGKDRDFSVCDVLRSLWKKKNDLDIDKSFLKRIHDALQKRDGKAARIFVGHVMESCDSHRTLLAMVRLLETNEISDVIYKAVLESDDPLESVEDYLSSLKRYENHNEVNLQDEEFSDSDFLALYSIFCRKYAAGEVDYKRFMEFLSFEAQLAFSKPLVFDEFKKGVKAQEDSTFYQSFMRMKRMFKASGIEKSLNPIAQKFLSSPAWVKWAFLINIEFCNTVAELEAAIELLENGLAIWDTLFTQYASLSIAERQAVLSASAVHARAMQASNSEPASMEDLGEVMATLKILNHSSLSNVRLKRIWEKLEVAALDPSVNISEREFSVPTARLPRDIHHTIDKGRLLKLADEAQRMGTTEGACTVLQAVSGRVDFDKGLKMHSLLSEKGEESKEKKLPEAIDELIQKSGQKIPRGDMRSLLVARVWRSEAAEDLRENISNYTDVKEGSDVIKQALDALMEFYKLVIAAAEKFNVSIFKRGEEEKKKKLKEQLFLEAAKEKSDEEIFAKKEDVTLQFTPSRNKMDAFYPLVARNCLADEVGFSVHALAQTQFLPYRIKMNGRWVGVVQTYTIERRIRQLGMDKKKILILAGIDPNPGWVFEPRSFVKGVLDGFQEIARWHGYDMVVVPAVEGMMSSRRTSLVPEIKKHCKELIQVTKPFGFPRKGPGDAPTSFYKGRKQWEFYVVGKAKG